MNIESRIPFGYGKNTEWLNNSGSIAKIINCYDKDEPMVIFCGVPSRLPQKIEECSPLHLLFLEAAEIMKNSDCLIISTTTRDQFKEQCEDGYQVLNNNRIWHNKNHIPCGEFWFEKDENNNLLTETRDPMRIVNAIRNIIFENNKLTFIILPGSLRIGDAVFRMMVDLGYFKKAYVIDAESAIETISKQVLSSWGRNPNEFICLAGPEFVNTNPVVISRILLTSPIVIICINEAYNSDSSIPLLVRFINTIKTILSDNHRIMITYPGGEEGILLKHKNLKVLELKNDIAYTIIIDKYDNEELFQKYISNTSNILLDSNK